MEQSHQQQQRPSPMTMFLVTSDLQRMDVDGEQVTRLMDAIAGDIAQVRDQLEASTEAAFATHNTALQAANATLTTIMDTLIVHINELRAQLHQSEKNANEFYTRCIDTMMSHRLPAHPLRPRGAPLMVDIRQTALGNDTLIEDDEVPSADLLNLSLF